jgi:hypothetical protein
MVPAVVEALRPHTPSVVEAAPASSVWLGFAPYSSSFFGSSCRFFCFIRSERVSAEVKPATPLILLNNSSSCAAVGRPTAFKYPTPPSVLAGTNLLTMTISPLFVLMKWNRHRYLFGQQNGAVLPAVAEDMLVPLLARQTQQNENELMRTI